MRLPALRRAHAALVCALLYGAALGAATPAAAAGPLSPAAVEDLRAARAGDMGKLAIHTEPKEVPQVAFLAEDGSERRLGDWRGKLTVVNLWATWCGPCRHEMPSLDALKADLADEGIDVIAVNVERKGLVKARRFYTQEGIETLEVLVDRDKALPTRLGVIGYPVTLILDPEGREIARMQGDADWHSPEALAILRRFSAAVSETDQMN
ncbi:TlpA disulfide reductase family protein [Rhodovulum sp. DZ06]|uniref:TlpA disulfide reductase family protein n=1 Tax=Rhodovulum sp. DZ06 TaxID=3425126 RepID=UPI003D3346D8